MKKIVIIALGILFVWFTLDITGFAIKDFVLVISAFKDEPIDVVWWAIFLIATVLFIWKDKIGKYIIAAFLVIWAFIQCRMYFIGEQGIKSYNNYFINEGTHRILPTSNTFLVKDTYHIFLDILILFSLICVFIFVVKSLAKSRTN